ncbi:MAG: shikimate dehydrogenase [bacterium]
MSKALRCGLIGHNITYSKSAELFRAMFNMLNMEGRFEIFDVAPSDLEQTVRRAAADRFDGLCVTIPYKQAVMSLIDEAHPVAEALGAVNSIAILKDGRLQGRNTDCFGFSLPLRDYVDQLKHGRGLIIGSGGGARAAIYSLCTDYELNDIAVLGRTTAPLKRLCTSLQDQLRDLEIRSFLRDDATAMSGQKFDIVVNCTPLGGWNFPNTLPLPACLSYAQSHIYYDLNYNADNTAVASARKAGLTAIDGALMLAGQAARSMEIWSGRKVSVEQLNRRVFGR